jgi:hypothetical protein
MPFIFALLALIFGLGFGLFAFGGSSGSSGSESIGPTGALTVQLPATTSK